jgi:AcrR family transcriptional regulator
MKQIIIEAIKDQIRMQGIDFNLDHLAKQLKISKKTLYKYFDSKENMLNSIIIESYHEIKIKQKMIHQANLEPLDKIKRLLQIIPVNHDLFSNENIIKLKSLYPNTYQMLVEFFESDWDDTFNLMINAQKTGLLKDFDLNLFRHIYVAGLLFPLEEEMTYQKRIEVLIDYIFHGVKK